jgi:hypothetical protein
MNAHAREQRIRDKAYQMWIDEGQPDGRADAHWDMATELVATEENQLLTLKPVEDSSPMSPNGEASSRSWRSKMPDSFQR